MANEVRVLITAVDKATPKLNDVTKASLALGATFSALAVASVKMSADFEKGLSGVAAVSGATAQEMEKLRAKAMQIGSDTAFTASEAVSAMQMLAQQGISTADIMGGAADAVTALAAAGGTDLTTAANVASTAMITWGKSASDLGGVVNYIAGVANVSKFNVEDMAQAMAMGGGVAASAGVSFEEFSTVIAATATSFASGSDAGTSFKTFLTRLADPSKEAAKAMAEIGFSAYDAQGNLKSMADITQNLHDALAPLTEQQRAQAAATIFGADAMRTALGLAKLTGDEFAAMNAKIAGTNAADVAAKRMDNLAGQIEQLKGSLQTLGINIGSAVIPMLSKLAEAATGITNGFTSLPASTQSLTLLTLGITAATPAFVNLGEKAKKTFDAIRDGTASTSTKIGGWVAVIGTAVTVIDLLLSKTTGYGVFDRLFGDIKQIENAKQAVKDFAAETQAAGEGASKGAVAAKMAWDEFFAKWGDDLYRSKGMTGWVEDDIPKVRMLGEAMKQAGVPISVLQLQFERFNAIGPDLGKNFGEASGITAAWAAHLRDLNSASDVGVTSALNELDILAAGVSNLGPKAMAQAPGFDALAKSLNDGAKATADFRKNMEGFFGIFDSKNPKMMELTATIAVTSKAIADLKAKGDDMTESDKAQVKVLEDKLEKLNLQKDALEASKKVMEDTLPAVSALIGEEGYEGLITAMNNLGTPAETQQSIMGELAGVYSKLQSNDIPGVIGALGSLQQKLDPTEWAAITKNLAPTLSQAIGAAFSGPEADKIVAAAEQLGINIDEGLIRGLQSAAGRITATGHGITRGLIDEMEKTADVGSPSKITTTLGENIAAGLQIGLASGSPMVFEQGKWTMTTLLDIMAQTAADDRQKELLGSAGVSLIQALDEAIAKGGEGPVTRVANVVDQIVKSLTSKLPEAQAGYLGSKLMDALSRAITENTPEARNALADLLAQINTVLEGGAVDIKTGMIVVGDSIKEIAKVFGVSGKEVISAISAVIAGGVTSLTGDLSKLPATVRENIGKIIAELAAGLISVEQAVQAIQGALGSVPGLTTSSGGVVGGIDPATGKPVTDSNGNLVGVAGYDWQFDPMQGGWVQVPVNYGSQMPAAGGFSDTNKPPVGYTSSDFPGLVWNGTNWQSINVPLPGGASPMPVNTNLNTWFGSGVGNSPTFGGQAGIAVGTKNSYGYYWDGSKWVNHPVAVPSHALGTPYVTHDGLAFLHQGEAVIPADKNTMGGASVINLVVDGQVLARVVNTHNQRAGVR